MKPNTQPKEEATMIPSYCHNYDDNCDEDHCRCNKKTPPAEDVSKPNLTH